MKHLLPLIFFLIGLSPYVNAQQPFNADTAATAQLEEVTVQGFGQQATLSRTPAAISTVGATLLQAHDNSSIVSALNASPGVRMEERSPGSYRLAIRGSALRAPFGVRNVKIYYNGIPFTDPGGTTYLNQLGYYNIASVEILKGPGSSTYGAGTGGVLLINSEAKPWTEGAQATFTGGSFGMWQAAGEIRIGKEHAHQTVRYQQLASDGYRAQTALKRSVLSWDVHSAPSPATALDAHFLYGNLEYQTPGALTLSEYEANPLQARPRAGVSPSATEAGASIRQQLFLAGFSLRHQFSTHWTNKTTLYGSYAQMQNPNIRNYSQTAEPNVGGRSVFTYETGVRQLHLQWQTGAEMQQNFTTIATYRNRGGSPDSLQSHESVQSRQLFGFTQASLQLPAGWTVTAGLSVSQLQLRYDLLSSPAYLEQTRNFRNELSPRIALLKRWHAGLTTYGVAARGFSPPTSSELAPSGSALNLDLAPEQGWNYELGARGTLLANRLTYDVSGYYFSLRNTIVQRRDAAGGDYYTNSGNTRQLGAEASVEYRLLPESNPMFEVASIRAAYSYQHFRYGSFAQLDQDFSGNRLPGVSPHAFSATLNLRSRSGLYLNLSEYVADAIPLNDANTASTAAYQLLNVKLGYALRVKKKGTIELFCGSENLTDTRYVAGPDINAFGGRYYNTSPGRSFYAGLSLQYVR